MVARRCKDSAKRLIAPSQYYTFSNPGGGPAGRGGGIGGGFDMRATCALEAGGALGYPDEAVSSSTICEAEGAIPAGRGMGGGGWSSFL